MDMKTCRGCGAELPATTEFFSRSIDKPGGLAYKCKPCRNADVSVFSARYKAKQNGVAPKESRRVYANHYGGIREGYEIHHIDGDPSNNSLDNLIELTPLEHKRTHAGWKLVDGEWHKPCSRCGEVMNVSNFSEHIKGSGRYQSKCKACANKYPERECPFCGKTYTPCYADQKSCGRNCEGKKRK